MGTRYLFKCSRWWTLIFSILLEISAGIIYLFSLYSPDLKEHLDFSQDEIQLVGSFLNFGIYISIFVGFFYDRFGPRLTGYIGSISVFIGYFLLFLSGSKTLPSSLSFVCFCAFFSGTANAWLDTAAIVTNSINFPMHRGTVIALLKAFLGLSASLNTQVYVAFFAPESIHFLLFISFFMMGITAVAVTFTNIADNSSQDKYGGSYTKRFIFIAIIIVTLDIFTSSTAVVESQFSVSRLSSQVFTGIIGALLLSLWVVPLLWRDANAYLPVINYEEEPLVDTVGAEKKPEEFNVTWLQALRQPQFWFFFLSMFCGAGTGMMIVNNIGQIVQSFGGAHDEQDVYISVFSVASSLGRLVSGVLAQILEKRLNRPWFYMIAVGLMSGSCLFTAFADLNMLFAGVVIAGFAFGSYYSLMPAIAADLYGTKSMGAIYNTLGVAPTLGFVAISQQMAAKIYQSHIIGGGKTCFGQECYRLTFLVCAGVCGLATFAAMYVCFSSRKRYQQIRDDKIVRLKF